MNARFLFILFSLDHLLRLSSPAAAAESSASNRDAAKRARVVIVQEPGATATFNAQPGKIPPMIQRGLTNLTGKASLRGARKASLFFHKYLITKTFLVTCRAPLRCSP